MFKDEFLYGALDHAVKIVDKNMDFYIDQFPAPASIEQVYPAVENVNWTNAFWTGMVWLAFEVTGEQKYKRFADHHIELFEKRLKDRIVVDHHDLGFLYSLSCVSAYKLTGNKKARQVALDAAEYLLGRYHEKAGILQAWGDIKTADSKEKGRMIIDCNMNLPLLYWASEESGDDKYKTIAENHIKQAQKYIVRDDYSTYHTYYMCPETGKALRGATHQGYSDESCWARGQAWGIYGFLLNYKYTGDESLLDLSCKLADYYLARLPKDYICYWDLCFTKGDEERDSSSAAIALCGLMELIKHLPKNHPRVARYKIAIRKTLESLRENYTVQEGTKANGILKHGVYNKNGNNGVDESCIWGDYFYFEALVRAYKDWEMYW